MNWVFVALGLTFFLWGLDNTDIFEGKELWRKYMKRSLGWAYFVMGIVIIWLASLQ